MRRLASFPRAASACASGSARRHARSTCKSTHRMCDALMQLGAPREYDGASHLIWKQIRYYLWYSMEIRDHAGRYVTFKEIWYCSSAGSMMSATPA